LNQIITQLNIFHSTDILQFGSTHLGISIINIICLSVLQLAFSKSKLKNTSSILSHIYAICQIVALCATIAIPKQCCFSSVHLIHRGRSARGPPSPAGEGKTTWRSFDTLFVGTGVLDCPHKNDVTLRRNGRPMVAHTREFQTFP